jgi:hypothetical protein
VVLVRAQTTGEQALDVFVVHSRASGPAGSVGLVDLEVALRDAAA